jgi:hypothetical protein
MRVPLLLIVIFAILLTAWVEVGRRVIDQVWTAHAVRVEDFFRQSGRGIGQQEDDAAVVQLMGI